jgi:hypothetical protein
MFESLLSLVGTTVVVVLSGAVALFLLSLVVVVVGCFLGLGTELCRTMRGWLQHSDH